jgi:hypothetical protein
LAVPPHSLTLKGLERLKVLKILKILKSLKALSGFPAGRKKKIMNMKI